jgi:ABC-type uncharacterized transport system permease subunit
MALVQINKNPSRRDLAWFGVLFAFFFGLLGFFSYRRHGLGTAATLLWGAAVVVPVVYYAIPPLRRPIFLGWIYLVYPIGLAVSFIVLGLVYFLVVTPVGLALRLTGRDPMERAFQPSRQSYWIEHRTGGEAARYFRQY